MVRLTDRAGHRVGMYGYSFDANPSAVALICDDKVATADLLGRVGLPMVPHELVIEPSFASWVGQNSVGERLDQAQGSYRQAMDRLATGRGNVVRQAEMLKLLGVKPAKTLPQNVIDISDIDHEKSSGLSDPNQT